MNPNPNNIIALLLDVAHAAYVMMHTRAETPGNTLLVRGDDGERLLGHLLKLDTLPQPKPGDRLTGPACARTYLASFLTGLFPDCRTDGRCEYAIDHGAEGIAACPPGECARPQRPLPPGPNALRDQLLADSVDKAAKILGDADLLEQLRSLCGYVENGSSETVHIGQDDATKDWFLSVGYNSMGGKKRSYTSTSFHQVIRVAAEAEIEKEECKFCGVMVEFPCTEPSADICETAINAFYREAAKPPTLNYGGPERRHRPRFITASSVSSDPAFAYTDKTGRYLNRGERMQERHIHEVRKLVEGGGEEL